MTYNPVRYVNADMTCINILWLCYMEKYDMYKHIFSGAMSLDDTLFLRRKCPKEDHSIVDTIIRTAYPQYSSCNTSKNDTKENQGNTTCIGIENMHNIINVLNTFTCKDECVAYLKKVGVINKCIRYDAQLFPVLSVAQLEKTMTICDKIQLDTIGRIVASKQDKYEYIDLPKIGKKCPHCGKMNYALLGTRYIVCGIDMDGILPINNVDTSCLNDWCFECGKKLCKNWYSDKLYDIPNRVHTIRCCLDHAMKNGFQYPIDYCQCIERR